MHWIVWIGSLAFGAAIGSFLNVCIHRIPRGESLVRPSSHCPRCGAGIRWYDNIPIVSYLFLRGKCRACGAQISPRYALVEGISALLCLILVHRYGLDHTFAIYYALGCALVVVTFIDLDHQIIPNAITYPGIPLGVLASFVLPEMNIWKSLLGIIIGGGVLMLAAFLFEWIRKKEGMGFGDVKLLAMIGAFLGWKGVVLTLVISSAVGALVGYASLRLTGKGSETPIPYGPFLSLGAMVFLLGGKAWLDWYLGLAGR